VFDVSAALRERGWQVPAYTFPKNRANLAALRIVVRRGFTMDVADMLLDDLMKKVAALEKLPAPMRRSGDGAGFHH
jgi:glutamate decarboxylase